MKVPEKALRQKRKLLAHLTASGTGLILAVLLMTGMLPGAFTATADDAGTTSTTSLRGVITSLPAAPNMVGAWKVNLNTVHVSSTTVIDQDNGKAGLGSFVEVTGTLQGDGSIAATRITVRFSLGGGGGFPVSITGTIDELPSTPNRIGDWKVNGLTVRVTATTIINEDNGPVAVGKLVRIDVLAQLDASFSAIKIETRPGYGGAAKLIARIEKLPDTPGRIGNWVIGGRVVRVTGTTVIRADNGVVAIGVIVEVEGALQPDGSINATKIVTRNDFSDVEVHVRFIGTVESLPGTPGQTGDWKISGRTVHVTDKTSLTELSGPVMVGHLAGLQGIRRTDGSINATDIVTKESSGFDDVDGFTRFFGRINSLPGTAGFLGEWDVGGQKVQVTSDTMIKTARGAVEVGAFAEVLAVKKASGLEAIRIEIRPGRGDSEGYIRFIGRVSSLPGTTNHVGDWVVSRRTVHVSESTEINQDKGPVEVGAIVEVRGNLRSDGTVDAREIVVKTDIILPPGTIAFAHFFGKVKSLPATDGFIGEWQVGSRTVHVTAKTRINQKFGPVAVDALVEVSGFRREDGSVEAQFIRVLPSFLPGIVRATLIEFVGKITSLPDTEDYVGDWIVDGRTVRVHDFTRIRRDHGMVAVGATVEVRGALQTDGTVDALLIEVQPTSDFESYPPLASVSAGSYQNDNAADSIIAAFGSNLASTTQTATKLPLPTSLGGVSVLVDGRPAGLFFVSPTQINYLAPGGLRHGTAQVTVVNDNKVVAQGMLSLPGVAPSLFTADASGKGFPAGLLLRIRANQQQSYEPLARYDNGQQRFVAVPVQRQIGELLYLVLFGTGFRNAPDSDGNAGNGVAENIEVTINGVAVPVHYAGPAPGYAGLDQLNIELLPDIAAGASVTVTVRVLDGLGNVLRANTVTIAIQ